MPVLLNATARMMLGYSLTADAMKHNTHEHSRNSRVLGFGLWLSQQFVTLEDSAQNRCLPFNA
jgi:hypothetical protein